MVVMWRLLTSFGVAKSTKLTRGQTALVVTEVVRAAFVWGQNSPEARTMSLAFTIKKR